MRYRYAGVLAIDPNTETTTVVRSATGTIHVGEDWDTPVTVFDVNNFPMTTINTSSEGLFPDFYVEDEPVVGFKTSSGHRFYLLSSTPQPGEPGPVPSSTVVEDGQIIFVYPDGTRLPGPVVPEYINGRDGQDGQDGATPQITFDTTTTLAAGTNAYATYTWEGINPRIKFHIPRGAAGQNGDVGFETITQSDYDALNPPAANKTYFVLEQ